MTIISEAEHDRLFELTEGATVSAANAAMLRKLHETLHKRRLVDRDMSQRKVTVRFKTHPHLLEEYQRGRETFSMGYRLIPEVREWMNHSLKGPLLRDTEGAGNVWLEFKRVEDAVLFKTFWL